MNIVVELTWCCGRLMGRIGRLGTRGGALSADSSLLAA